MFQLIAQINPPVVFGEQVASPDGLAWLDLIQTDLEAAGHAFGAVDLCAAGVGAPHIRQRLFFVAEWLGNSELYGSLKKRKSGSQEKERRMCEPERPSSLGRMADDPIGRDWALHRESGTGIQSSEPDRRCRIPGRLADSDRDGRIAGSETAEAARYGCTTEPARGDVGYEQPSPVNGIWQDADWLLCRDGKWRPVEPGTFPLAHGAPARVGRDGDLSFPTNEAKKNPLSN